LETTLFWIGCGLGGYAFVLRQIFKKETLLNQRTLVSTLHVLFMGTVGALIGFVVSASVDLHGPTPRYPVALGVIGLIWGLYQSSREEPDSEGPSLLLAGDLDLVETSFSAVLLAAVIMYAVVQAFKIPSGSMEDTLHIGDHLFVNKFIYGIRIPWTEKRVLKLRGVRRGDVVVFQCPDAALSPDEREHHVRKDFIKRAVAIAGDTVMVKNKKLYINGELQQEPYAIYRDTMLLPDMRRVSAAAEFQKAWETGELAQHSYVRDNFGPVTVPAGDYFVMGDNRDGSFDARFWGPLPNRLLKGKAWFLYWPIPRVKVIR
jgi:signal peptidase I